MQEIIEKVFRNFIDFFNGLNTVKKIGAIGVFAFIITTMAGIVTWASKTRYETLYTDLNRDDSQKITILLEENKISYQTSEDGKTIKVPEDQVKKWRIKMATLGVSFSGTLGYEVFDKQSFGTTSFVQRVNKQRALEGELVKTIKYIRGIKRARVHLNIPESSPFVSEKKTPSASVVLELQNGVTLTTDEIKGVSSLISSSIEGMRPQDVVILNGRGKKLSDNIGDPMTIYTSNRMALEQKINQQYERQISEILSSVVGDGKVIAKVTVELDFTKSVSTETTYDQEAAAIISEVTNEQDLNGKRPSPQGIPGARSNTPGVLPQPGIPETTNNVKKKLSTKNYNVPSKITRSNRPTAGVRKISAAVMIDGKRVPMVGENGAAVLDKDGKQMIQYEKWSESEIANFSAIVSSTLGIDVRRGDILTIRNMEFVQKDLEAIDAMLKDRENRELIKDIIKYLAVGLAITLFFFLVVRPFIQWVTDNTVESVEDFLPKTLIELEKVQANQKLPGLEDALPQIEEKLNPEKIEGNMLKEKIVSLVESNPSKAAQVLHDMIHSAESDKQIA